MFVLSRAVFTHRCHVGVSDSDGHIVFGLMTQDSLSALQDGWMDGWMVEEWLEQKMNDEWMNDG